MTSVEELIEDIEEVTETSEEEWRVIPGFELYEVSDRGRVRRIGGRVMSAHTKDDGYVHIKITPAKGEKPKSKLLHHLVAAAFYPDVVEFDEIHHKDHNPENNAAENIEKVTKEKNRAERRNNGIINQGIGARRAVWQCDAKSENKIRRFDSSSEALAFLGKGSPQGICGALSGRRKTFMGYSWKFVETDLIENELWKDLQPELIRGEQGYKLSSEGRLKDRRGSIREGYEHTSGYLRFSIGNHDYCVHVLVAKTFLPNYFGKRIANHKNGNKKDPRLFNLQWATDSENILHAHRTGLIKSSKPVKQLSLDGKFVARFDSLAAAGLALGVDPGKIGAAANKHSFSGSYRWEFADSTDQSYKGRAKGVRQLTLDGQTIRDFPTTDKAAKFIGRERSVFRKAVQRNEIISGYKWAFLN